MKRTTPVIMLTHNDITVPNALELFEECRDLPAECWGIKDIGMDDEGIIAIGRRMKAAGKRATYEIVEFSEQSYERAARLAIAGKFSCVACGDFNQNLSDFLQIRGIDYMPSCGRLIHDPEPQGPCVLVSDKPELLESARYALSHGATGLDCAFYRSNLYGGDGLLRWIRAELPDAYLCCAGSVSSYARIDFVCGAGFDGFTTGSALFNRTYVPEGTFRDNLKALCAYMAAKEAGEAHV